MAVDPLIEFHDVNRYYGGVACADQCSRRLLGPAGPADRPPRDGV